MPDLADGLFSFGMYVANWVTKWVCEKIAQNIAQPIFRRN
jgi:hypothetical protein